MWSHLKKINKRNHAHGKCIVVETTVGKEQRITAKTITSGTCKLFNNNQGTCSVQIYWRFQKFRNRKQYLLHNHAEQSRPGKVYKRDIPNY